MMTRTVGIVIGLGVVALVAGCGGSGALNHVGAYYFASNSDELTNPFFPGQAGDVMRFVGTSGDFTGDQYTWTFTAGPPVQGVKTLQEEGSYTSLGGAPTQVFASLLAQDIQGNVHVLANRDDLGQWVPSGAAAGEPPTMIMVSRPAVGDLFHPNGSLSGAVIGLNEVKPGYTGLLHTRMTAAGLAPDVYDDYWAVGVGQVLSEWVLGDGRSGTWSRLPN